MGREVLNRKVLFVVGGAAVIAAVYFYFFKQHVGFSKSKTVAIVGDFEITQENIAQRNAITKVYYPDDNRDLGLQLLVKSFTTAQVLKDQGRDVSDAVLVTESKRIDSTSLRPEMLQKIKDIFAGDEAAYRKIYVLQVYVDRVIYYDFFLKNEAIHSSSKQKALKFLQETSTHTDKFTEMAKASGLSVSTFDVSKAEGVRWNLDDHSLKSHGAMPPQPTAQTPKDVQDQMKSGNAAASKEGEQWLNEVVAVLKPGQVFSKVMDRGEFWLVARYLGVDSKDKGRHRFSGVGFPKEDFASWFERQAQAVKVVRLQ